MNKEGRYDRREKKMDEILTILALKGGPMYLSEIVDASRRPRSGFEKLSTTNVLRILKILLDAKEVKVYRQEAYRGDLKKTFYGLEFLGLVQSLRGEYDDKVKSDFEKIIQSWCKQELFTLNPDFKTEIETEKVAESVKGLFCHFADAMDVMDELATADLDAFSQLSIGSLIQILSDPEKYREQFRTLVERSSWFKLQMIIQFGQIAGIYLAILCPKEYDKFQAATKEPEWKRLMQPMMDKLEENEISLRKLFPAH